MALEEQRRRAAVELHNVVIVDRTQFSPNIRNRQALLDFGGQVMGRRVKGPAWSVSPQRREGHHSPNGTAGAVEDPNGTESRRHHHEADNRHSYVEYVTSPPNGHSVGGRSDGRLYDTFDAVLAVGDIKGLDIASRLAAKRHKPDAWAIAAPRRTIFDHTGDGPVVATKRLVPVGPDAAEHQLRASMRLSRPLRRHLAQKSFGFWGSAAAALQEEADTATADDDAADPSASATPEDGTSGRD